MRIPSWILVALVLVAWTLPAAAQEPDPTAGVPLNTPFHREAMRRALALDQSGSLPKPRRQVQCNSRKQGAILGAVIGGAAGGFFAYLVERRASSAYADANHAGRAGVVVKFGLVGAGVGVVIGIGACGR